MECKSTQPAHLFLFFVFLVPGAALGVEKGGFMLLMLIVGLVALRRIILLSSEFDGLHALHNIYIYIYIYVCVCVCESEGTRLRIFLEPRDR